MNSIKKYIYKQVAAQKLTKEEAKELLMDLQNIPSQGPEREPVAIIGIGLRYPDSNSTPEFWANLCEGKRSIKEFPKEREKDFANNSEDWSITHKKGGYLARIDTFDANYFNIAPSEARYMNPLQRVFLEIATEAVEDAGYAGSRIKKTKTGVYVGIDHTSKLEYPPENHNKNPLAITGSWTGILASRVSYELNLRGPSMVIDTACSSGLVAVHVACKAIQNQECEMAIAGGICLEQKPAMDDDALNMVFSKDNSVRAFDKSANGTVWGEGVGVVLLKPWKKAVEDKDHIYAIVKGSAINNDGASNGITAPDAEAQEEVLVAAWEDAGINPESLTYIEAHGTGTVLGDPIEVKGLTNAFARYTSKKQFCGIGSVKTNIGHTVAASGMASLMKVILSLQKGKIPGSLNFEAPNRYINFSNSPLYVVDKTREWQEEKRLRRAGVSAFGFSGTNCHVVLEEAERVKSHTEWGTGEQEGLTMSAKTPEVLVSLLEKYENFLSSNEQISKEAICYTANTGREHQGVRIAILFEDIEELKEKIGTLVQRGLKENENEGIYYEARAQETAKSEKEALTQYVKKIIEEVRRNSSNSIRLKELCKCYVKGADVSWEAYYEGMGRYKVSLPTYPYEKTRYWFDHIDETSEESKTRCKREKLRQLWMRILGAEDLDPSVSFYEIGGNSLLAIQLIDEMNQLFSEQVDITDLFSYPSVDLMIAYMDRNENNTEFTSPDYDNDLMNLIRGVRSGKITIENSLKHV